ncbi:MAG: enoyl-CoA hydratase/isomerase family protein [Burkholderiaceae bacterium]
MTFASDSSDTHAIAEHDGAPTLTRTDHVWTITLARPAQHNRLDPADVTALSAVFDQARAARPKLLVITGRGEKTFCSGYTLSAIASELDQRFEVMLNQLESLPFLTIAALNGSAYGGATDLALCCDIRLGVPGIRLFMPAAKFGLHYYPDGLRRYVNLLGLPLASKLMLTGMTIEADEMLRVGYLTELVDAGDLTTRVQAYADATALTEPTVVAEMKEQMRGLATQQTDASLEQLKNTMQQSYQSSLKSEALQTRVADLLKR